MIDNREPQWIRELKFGGLPISTSQLECGDIWAATDDGHMLLIERKTPDDFLNSLKENRLFVQLAKLAEKRIEQQLKGEKITFWPYLVITGTFQPGQNGKTVTNRETGWDYASIMGSILSIQELGVFVVFCTGDLDFENCILRLIKRKRDDYLDLLPPRPANLLGPKDAFVASLPGVGVERAEELLRWANWNLAHLLCGIVDLNIKIPAIGEITRKKIRTFLGLMDNETIELSISKIGDEILVKEKI